MILGPIVAAKRVTQSYAINKNVCLKNVEKVVLKPLKMRERKVLQTRSVMMDELEETHSRKVPAVELSPNELKKERIEKLTDLELSKKMIVAFQNWL